MHDPAAQVTKLRLRESFGGESPNMVILGDNCSVCDCLAEAYKRQVKCIYIDPPYNNGEEYSHYKDVSSHKQWLEDMHSILSRLYRLLSDDGSMWISIDDNELHYLKVLCDETFGREKFVSTIVWQHRTTRENRKVFSNNHEYILLYAKNPAIFKKSRNLLRADASIPERYGNPDNDSRGLWQSVSLNAQAGHAVSSQFYTIVAPNGLKHNPPNGRCWVYNEERMLREISENNVWFGRDGNGVPRKKKFLSESALGVTPETLWTARDVGTTNDAKKQLLSMFPSMIVFDTPKPESLIKQVLEISTRRGDLVLDAFLGSGTTAATAHKMHRSYIGVDSSPESIRYAIQRLKSVISGECGGISKAVSWKGGGAFSWFKLEED
ncbi:MAG: site-specific DNA-methyltransferase [Candidatus Cryosericum sp.]